MIRKQGKMIIRVTTRRIDERKLLPNDLDQCYLYKRKAGDTSSIADYSRLWPAYSDDGKLVDGQKAGHESILPYDQLLV